MESGANDRLLPELASPEVYANDGWPSITDGVLRDTTGHDNTSSLIVSTDLARLEPMGREIWTSYRIDR